MTTVKIVKRVPLLNEAGEIYTPFPGAVVEVTTDIADALVRGGDAEYCAGKQEAEEPAPEPAPEPVQEASFPKQRHQRGKKNAGAAPENKDAGRAPEDK